MKIQDILFLIFLTFLVYKRNPKYLFLAGIFSLILSIPLFYFWVFFTAQRLVEYAAALFFLGIIFVINSLYLKRND